MKKPWREIQDPAKKLKLVRLVISKERINIAKNVSICRSMNRPFPSSKKSHFQSEAKCEAIDMKMSLNYDANKTQFHNKGFALSLVLKVRFFGTRKWPINYPVCPWNRRF